MKDIDISVVDEIMSTGKSTWAFSFMRELFVTQEYEQFVYLSPLLSEVGGEPCEVGTKDGRIQKELPEMNFIYPLITENKTKRAHVMSLIENGMNIAATHSLFLNLPVKTKQYLKETRNVLFIDETLDVFNVYTGITKKALNIFLDNNVFFVNEHGKLKYNHDKYPLGENTKFEFIELVDLCDNDCLYYVDGEILIWEFPPEIIKSFDDVYVLTYMFDGSLFKHWADLNNIEYKRINVSLIKDTDSVRKHMKENIELINSPSALLLERFPYTNRWWLKASDYDKNIIKKSLQAIVRSCGVRSDDIVITCKKTAWYGKKGETIKGKGYSRATWLYSEARATNDYSDKTMMIYLVNKFYNPVIVQFLRKRGIEINRKHEDTYALASMLQWIYRGSTRKGQKMKLVIGSKRMKSLYASFIEGEQEK